MTIEVGDKVLCIWDGEQYEVVDGYVPEVGEKVLCRYIKSEPSYAVMGLGSFSVGDLIRMFPGGIGYEFGFDFPPFVMPTFEYMEPQYLASLLGYANIDSSTPSTNCLGSGSSYVNIEPGGWIEAAWGSIDLSEYSQVTVYEETFGTNSYSFNPNDYIYPTKLTWPDIEGYGEICYISFKYPNIIRIDVPSGTDQGENGFELTKASIDF